MSKSNGVFEKAGFFACGLVFGIVLMTLLSSQLNTQLSTSQNQDGTNLVPICYYAADVNEGAEMEWRQISQKSIEERRLPANAVSNPLIAIKRILNRNKRAGEIVSIDDFGLTPNVMSEH